jgi:3-carboxy-cis,cis-muconate cycloisomerase
MSARLIDALATTGPLAELFSDGCVLQAMLDFEVALARAEARAGVIPQTAADAIASAARPDAFNTANLAHDTFRAGTPGIPLAKALTEVVCSKDASAAGFVHWGATSQDVADTALVLLLKRAQPILADDLTRCERSLERLSEQYKETMMLGRTLLQAGPPVTFGLKAAGWLGAIRRGAERLDAAFDNALVLQFGGATGTLASLGENGPAVARALADELGLQLPEAPWHTQRDRLASLMCSCGVLTGSLGKMARDIALLMQKEVAEAAEPGGEGRGGSSSMPHKQNPIACSLALAAAHRVPGLVASFLSTMVQEHERGVGGWQAEWPIVSQIVQATGVAAASIAEVAEGVSLSPERMRANIEATSGTIFAERAATLLAAKLGRDRAQELVKDAVRKSSKEHRHLTEVLTEMPEVASHMDSETLRELDVPEKYLGSTDGFRRALLVGRKRSGKKER